MDTDDTLQRQLEMTPSTWEALRAQGVRDGDVMSVDFFYYCPDEPSARRLQTELARAAEELNVTSRKVGLLRRRDSWALSGRSKPFALTLPSLHSWVSTMVEAGQRHQSEFDGWGAQVPGD